MTLRPVVAGTGLAENKVIGAEDLAEGAGADRVHGAGLEIHQHGAGHVAACRSMRREKGKRASGAVGKILQTEFTNGRMSPAISGALDRRTAGGLVVIHVDPLELKVGVAAVGTGGVDAVLIANNLCVA